MVINRTILCLNPNNTGQRRDALGLPINGKLSDYFHLGVHYTGAVDKSRPRNQQSARNNAIYYQNQIAHASANYVVDDKEAYEMVPWNSDRIAWHIGIGANNTKDYYMKDAKGIDINNGNTIGIEICPSKLNPATTSSSDDDWYFDADTYRNAVELCRDIIKQFNIPRENVFRHYDCNSIHKVCPAPFVGNQIKSYYGKTGETLWQQFLDDVYSGIVVRKLLHAFIVNSYDGELNLRERPSNDAAIIKVMRNNDFVLAIQEQSDGWMLVKYVADNRVYVGYCFKKYLNIASVIENRCVHSPDGTLNIRANPTVGATLIVPMGNDYIFSVLKQVNSSWGLIWCGETIGYCNITDAYSNSI